MKLSKVVRESIEKKLKPAQACGDFQMVKRMLAILSLDEGESAYRIAQILKVSTEAIRQWIVSYLKRGLKGLMTGKKPGRPRKLTKSQRKELCRLIKAGPEKSGFCGSCWRSPMIQQLIHKRWGVFFSVKYISELLKSLGFSYQKAQFVAANRDEEARRTWLESTWKEVITLANQRNAMILFGDEASFPQWGTLSYTWAPIGKTPVIKTSGKRKGFKVWGLIDYFTGRFFAKGMEGKLNGDGYIAFLTEVLNKTRKPLILIQDGAPYHSGKVVKEFFEQHKKRITVYRLPTYSPDFNPIEKLWKKIKEKGTHLTYFPTFESLVQKVNDMLIEFQNAPREILSLFGFYENIEC
jgi:transposase